MHDIPGNVQHFVGDGGKDGYQDAVPKFFAQ
jgi:hypothetical protein